MPSCKYDELKLVFSQGNILSFLNQSTCRRFGDTCIMYSFNFHRFFYEEKNEKNLKILQSFYQLVTFFPGTILN